MNGHIKTKSHLNKYFFIEITMSKWSDSNTFDEEMGKMRF